MPMTKRGALFLLVLLTAVAAARAEDVGPETFRLYHGVTLFVNNAEGKDLTVTLDLRDLNLLGSGPREVLFKVYDPDGRPVIREVIPDDGSESIGYLPRLGGWDHELDYYALCYSRGSMPMMRWSAYSDRARLEKLRLEELQKGSPVHVLAHG